MHVVVLRLGAGVRRVTIEPLANVPNDGVVRERFVVKIDGREDSRWCSLAGARDHKATIEIIDKHFRRTPCR